MREPPVGCCEGWLEFQEGLHCSYVPTRHSIVQGCVAAEGPHVLVAARHRDRRLVKICMACASVVVQAGARAVGANRAAIELSSSKPGAHARTVHHQRRSAGP